jgi:murein DD-endopeptidase MepM/ murein hydrolase activator NlpD
VKVLAAADGTIWSSGMTPHGLHVVIDHGKPFATYYVHMSSLLVPSGIARGGGKIKVYAGQPLGVVGASPLDGQHLKHLHFEVWKDGGAESHTDPWPYIAHAPIVGAGR